MEYFINQSKIIENNIENICIICLEKISFKDKHFLHCGHCFHCYCIKKWLNMDKNNCPICKQNIECEKSFSDFEENNTVPNNSLDSNYSILFIEIYFIILLIIFMLHGFNLRIMII